MNAATPRPRHENRVSFAEGLPAAPRWTRVLVPSSDGPARGPQAVLSEVGGTVPGMSSQPARETSMPQLISMALLLVLIVAVSR
jgi:hypothetical protein